MPILGPFAWKNKHTLTPHPFTPAQKATLKPVTPGFDAMGIALVDVGKRTSTTFAHNFTKTGFAASLPKIAAMYAAFYLQDRLKTIKGAFGTSSLAQIERTLRREWRPALRATVPRSTGDAPDLTAIFASPAFDFKPRFKADLEAMMRQSNNAAAGRCIRSIGYDYLNGALTHGGFFSAADKEGLWLAADYTKSTHPANRDGARIPGLGSSQAASPKAVALLLLNLARDELVSAAASREMKRVMTNAYSWVRYEVEARHPGATVYGKLGLFKSTHDCAIVKHGSGHYVVVALFGGKSGFDAMIAELDKLAQQLFHHRRALEAVMELVLP